MEFENPNTSSRRKRRSLSAMIDLTVNRNARSFSVQYTSFSDLNTLDTVAGGNASKTRRNVSRSLSDTRLNNKCKSATPFRRHSVFPDIKYRIDTQTQPKQSLESTQEMALLPRRAKSTKGRIYNPPDALSYNPQTARLAYCRLEQRNEEVAKYGARLRDVFEQSEYTERQLRMGTFVEPENIDEKLVEHGLRPVTREITDDEDEVNGEDNKNNGNKESPAEKEFYDFEGFRLKSAKPDVWLDIKKKKEREKASGKEESEDENEELVGIGSSNAYQLDN